MACRHGFGILPVDHTRLYNRSNVRFAVSGSRCSNSYTIRSPPGVLFLRTSPRAVSLFVVTVQRLSVFNDSNLCRAGMVTVHAPSHVPNCGQFSFMTQRGTIRSPVIRACRADGPADHRPPVVGIRCTLRRLWLSSSSFRPYFGSRSLAVSHHSNIEVVSVAASRDGIAGLIPPQPFGWHQ